MLAGMRFGWLFSFLLAFSSVYLSVQAQISGVPPSGQVRLVGGNR
jgi:hypothetical protein